MGEWFSKMFSALGGQAESQRSVRPPLQAAQRDRVKVALEMSSAGQAVVMITTFEQVREDDIVISQPTIGGLTQPLAFGEALRMSFVHDSIYYQAPTRCLGRIKIPAGSGHQLLFAYRLAMPESLRTEDRRSQPRVQVSLTNPPEAHLYAPANTDGPVLGRVVDLSMNGAQIRTPIATGRIRSGQSFYLKAMLPEPIGLIDELVDVARVELEPRIGEQTIGIKFRRRIEGLEMFIRGAQSPHAPQQRRRTA